MSWFTDFFWPADAISNIQRDITALQMTANIIKKELRTMADRENAAYDALNATILTVKDGWAVLVASNAAKDARIAELEAALEAADPTAAVAAALEEDSVADAAKVEAADAALAELVAPPVEPA